MSTTVERRIAYHWSAREPIGEALQHAVQCCREACDGITIEVSEDGSPAIVVTDGLNEPVEFAFRRRRGAGTVVLASGARLILVSLELAAKLRLTLGDDDGQPFNPHDKRSWLARIPFAETAAEIERLAEAVGFLPRRIHLDEMVAPAVEARQGKVFF